MPTARTTPKKTVDADGIELVRVKLPHLNETYSIRKDVNEFLLLEVTETPGVVIKLMISFIAIDERQRFRAACQALSGFSEEKVYEVFMKMWEVASGGRPTTPSAASSRTTGNKAD